MWEPSCVVDVELDAATDAVISNVREALAGIGAMPRVNLAHSGASVFLAGRGPERWTWLVGRIETLGAFDVPRDRRNTFTSLEVDGLASASSYQRVLEDLFDAGIVTWLRLRPPHGDEALSLLRESGAPFYSHTNEELYGCSAAPISVTSAGTVAGRAIETFSPEELAELLGRVDGFQRFPTPFAFTAPDGMKVREYFSGGTQAMGYSISLRSTEVTLGFARGDFDGFFRALGGKKNEFSPMFHPTAAVGVVNEDGHARVVRTRRDMTPVVLVAEALVRADGDGARFLLGIAPGETWFAGQAGRELPVEQLPDETIGKLVTPALSVLASACGVIAASRVPMHMRERAARSLAYLGAPNARRVAQWIAHHAPEIGTTHLDAFRGDATMRAKRRAERPREALAHLRDQLERLLAAMRGAA
jgi:hypothetical protein